MSRTCGGANIPLKCTNNLNLMGCRRSACCDGRLGRGAHITMAAQPQAKSAVSKAVMDFYPEICVTVVLQQKTTYPV